MKITLLSLALIASANFFAFKGPKTYKVDTQKSSAVWTGKKVTGEHKGNVPISSGSVAVEGKSITGGTFDFNLASLTVTDITDPEKNTKLVTHLKNQDFFSTDKFPTSKFVITKATSKGGDNYEITGNLTIKGITNPVTFPATVKISDKNLTANGIITVNRTKFDIKYRSSSYFESLGDKTIYDDFTLEVNLVAGL